MLAIQHRPPESLLCLYIYLLRGLAKFVKMRGCDVDPTLLYLQPFGFLPSKPFTYGFVIQDIEFFEFGFVAIQ